MKTPKFITFTGVDDRTDKSRANELARKYPIEWGLLFSKNNKDARYPSVQTFYEFMSVAGKKSIHLCGKASRNFSEAASLPDEISTLTNHIDRIQVNGAKGISFTSYNGVDLILQCNKFSASPFYQLFDTSGGRGEMPSEIPSPNSKGLVGYAGGMGPETVIDYLNMINCENPFWIDMEQKVRTEGWFDLDKVEKVCKLVYG